MKSDIKYFHWYNFRNSTRISIPLILNYEIFKTPIVSISNFWNRIRKYPFALYKNLPCEEIDSNERKEFVSFNNALTRRVYYGDFIDF